MSKEIIRPSIKELVDRALKEERRFKGVDFANVSLQQRPKKPKDEVIKAHNKKLREVFKSLSA